MTHNTDSLREARAREALAAEYRREGHLLFANEIETGNLARTGMGTAIRAMLAFATAEQQRTPYGAQAEREAIVAYLRKEKLEIASSVQQHAVGFYANMVEDGAHLKALQPQEEQP